MFPETEKWRQRYLELFKTKENGQKLTKIPWSTFYWTVKRYKNRVQNVDDKHSHVKVEQFGREHCPDK